VLLAGRLAVVAMGCAAALGAAVATGTPPPLDTACPSGEVSAIIADGHKCLREGRRCRPQLDRQYHRYGFHCHRGRLETDYAPLRRAFHLPRLAPGAACPKTVARLRREPRPYGSTPLLGTGPAYPNFYSRRPYDPTSRESIVFAGPAPPGTEGDWQYVKVLWLVSPSYHGPLLVRGRQLDGTAPLRFWKRASDENRFYAVRELRLPGSPGWLRNGWRDLPSGSLFKRPGCYGYQVDGKRFSRTIVFQVAVD
jgi:hypothetical protein